MGIIYGFVIYLYYFIVGLAALFNNNKAKQWIEGRKNWEEKISSALKGNNKKRIWIHCASLGEFEQGRPVIEALRKSNPSLFIILSFFSPSGYELRKNYPLADYVCYLPVDTKRNARKFIQIISPEYAIFIKYEFWYNYFFCLKKNNIPLFLVSAIFRKSQVFFKWYGSFYRRMLTYVNHFFVQDENSLRILKESGIKNASITGDTRFDRVAGVINENKELEKIKRFRGDSRLIIAGSTWPEDEEIFFKTISDQLNTDLKIVVAPHEVSEKRILEIINKATSYFSSKEIVRYSSDINSDKARLLIIDNIGILSYAYRYGLIAWIGGGFGKGIHNILEAAAFGLPVIFGPEYKKFREAVSLMDTGGAFSVSDKDTTTEIFMKLLNDKNFFEKSSGACLEYVKQNTGATEKILAALPKIYS